MKFTKSMGSLVCVALAMLFVQVASAQRAFDVFNVPKVVILAPQQNIGPGASNTHLTNGPVETKMFDGLMNIFINNITNTGNTGGTLTAQVFTSQDQTNWNALSNYALISTTTQILYTNLSLGGTNLIGTNQTLLPGTYTNWTATGNLQAGVGLLPLPYTNSGAVTITTSGDYILGVSVGDQGRYYEIVWTPGGTVTNFSAGSKIQGYNESPLK